MSDLPQGPVPDNLPAERRLSNREFELVIRRAAELQARAAEEGMGGDGVSEGELLRIGRELGLSGSHLSRALAEVRGVEEVEEGLAGRLMGAEQVQATRAVAGDPDDVRRRLEAYLVEREYLAVLRRMPDRTLYTRAQGFVAAIGRATTQMMARSPLLDVQNLSVGVRLLEPGFTYVALSTSLRSKRNEALAWATVGGVTGSAGVGAVLGIAIAPPAALLGLPILAASVYASQRSFEGSRSKASVQLESLLDRLEHGELTLPTPRRR